MHSQILKRQSCSCILIYTVTQSWTSFISKLALISDLAGAKLHSSKNVQNNEVSPNLKFPGKQNLLCRLQMQFLGVGNRKNCQGYKYFPERKDMNKISPFFFLFIPKDQQNITKILKPTLLLCLYLIKLFLWESENKLVKEHLCKYK